MRRTQAERTEATTSGLVETAAGLFGRDGYAATSIDDVARAAGVTKGAVYHHFDGKIGLFRAVFVREEQRLVERLAAAAGGTADPWRAIRAGCAAFLDACLDPAVRQIILLDGPAVLGWQEVRRIEDDYLVALLRRGLERASGGNIEARTHLLVGALCEAGLLLARDPAAKAELRRELDLLLTAYSTR
ncbi:TetR/AcrR family transcriptional regulator [Micromonospora echinaurantiaca]|uniref:TetR/AcrR family transcriptional regulator n=1 Tax=Micromonospora echinaurantiaca TaxID=47857 RepID=UPI003444BB40